MAQLGFCCRVKHIAYLLGRTVPIVCRYGVLCASNAPHPFSCRATEGIIDIGTMTTDTLQGDTVKDEGPDCDRKFFMWVFNRSEDA